MKVALESKSTVQLLLGGHRRRRSTRLDSQRPHRHLHCHRRHSRHRDHTQHNPTCRFWPLQASRGPPTASQHATRLSTHQPLHPPCSTHSELRSSALHLRSTHHPRRHRRQITSSWQQQLHPPYATCSEFRVYTMDTFATGVGLVLKNGDVSINAYVRFSLYYHNRDCPAPVSGWPCWLRPAFSS